MARKGLAVPASPNGSRCLRRSFAFFILAHDLKFAVGLVRSPLQREIYGEAKGGGHWMDFSVLARDLDVGLTSVAGLFAIACLLVLPATWLLFRHRQRLVVLLERALRCSA